MSHVLTIKKPDGSFEQVEVQNSDVVSIEEGEIIFVDEKLENVNLEIVNDSDIKLSFANGDTVVIDRLADVIASNTQVDNGVEIPVLNFEQANALDLQSIDTYEKLIEALEASAAADDDEIITNDNLQYVINETGNDILVANSDDETLNRRRDDDLLETVEEEENYAFLIAEELGGTIIDYESASSSLDVALSDFDAAEVYSSDFNSSDDEYDKLLAEVRALHDNLNPNNNESIEQLADKYPFLRAKANENLQNAKEYLSSVEKSYDHAKEAYSRTQSIFERLKAIQDDANSYGVDNSELIERLNNAKAMADRSKALMAQNEEALKLAREHVLNAQSKADEAQTLENDIHLEIKAILDQAKAIVEEEMHDVRDADIIASLSELAVDEEERKSNNLENELETLLSQGSNAKDVIDDLSSRNEAQSIALDTVVKANDYQAQSQEQVNKANDYLTNANKMEKEALEAVAKAQDSYDKAIAANEDGVAELIALNAAKAVLEEAKLEIKEAKDELKDANDELANAIGKQAEAQKLLEDIKNTNLGPDSQDDSVTTNEDSALTIEPAILLNNDSDVDNDSLTIIAVNATENTHGTVALNSEGKVVFTPDENYNGPASFTYTISDGRGGTSTAVVSINVVDVNDAPTLEVQSTKTIDEDGSTTITYSASDIDGTIDVVATAPNGTVVVNDNGTISYTPNANYHGVDTITVTVKDDDGSVVTKTSTITVNSVNDAPTIDVVSSATVAEDGTKTINFSTNDIDGDTVSIVANASNGEVTITDGVITYTPNENYHGSDTIEVQLNDGNGGIVTRNIAVTVDSVNDKPIAVNDDFTNSSNGEVLVKEDFENGAQGWSNNTTTQTDTNATNFLGRFGGSNGNESVSKTFDLGIENAGKTVVIEFDMYEIDSWDDEAFKVFVNSQAVAEDYMSHYNRTWSKKATDEQDGGEAIDNIGSSGKFYLDHDEKHHYKIEAVVDENGQIKLGFGATIGSSISDESFGIDNVVISKPAPSTISATEDTILEIDPATLLANDSDIDGGTLSITTVTATDNTHGTVAINSDGKVVFTPDTNYNGEVSFTYTISDGQGGTSSAVVTLNVKDVNDVPTLSVENTKTVDEDGTTTITYNASDVDGTVKVVASAQNGTVVVNDNGTISYTPNANYHGTDTITVTTTDDDGAVVVKTSTITVNDINDAPTLTVESTKTVDEDGTMTITYSASDIDGTVAVNATAEHGTVVVNENGTISYTPDENYHGEDTITVVARDNDGAVITQTSTITVNDVNDAPVINVGDVTAVEDTTQVIANVSDIDGTIDSSNLSAENGTVTIADNGDITYTPNANYHGTDSITVTITDNDGATTTKTFDVEVASVNDGPVATNDSASDKTFKALDFSGDDQINTVKIVDSAEVGDQVTVSFWMKMDSPNGMPVGFDRYDLWGTGGKLGFNTAQGDQNGVSTEDFVGQWKHVTAVFTHGDTSQNKLYIDGVEQELSQVKNPSQNSADITKVFNLSGWGANEGYNFDGQLADVQLYDKALSPDEVKQVMAGETASDGLVAHYDFSGDNPLEDKSGNGNDATLERGELDVVDGPTINSGMRIAEDSSLTIEPNTLLGNDKDADGDTLSIISVEATSNTHGTVSLNDEGKVVFTPEANYNGEASFTYTISDGKGGTDTATVTLNVTSVNDKPTIDVVNTITLDEDGEQVINYSVADIDSNSVSLTSATSENGTVTINDNGTFTFKPNADFNGTDTITLEVRDSDGGVITKTIDVTVNAVNDGPVAVDDEKFEPKNATLAGELNFDEDTPTAISGSITSSNDGQVGKSADFSSGKTSLSDMDLSSEAGAKTTVSMWVKGNPEGSWEMLAASERYDLSLLNGNIGFNTGRGDHFAGDASALNDGKWHHVVATFTNGDVTQNKIFIDGEELELSQVRGTPSTTTSNIDANNDGTMYFGSWGNDNNYKFSGSMDEVKVFNGELSADEVASLHAIESKNNKWDSVSISTDEDIALIIEPSQLLANDKDVDGDTLTIIEVSATEDTHGTVIINDDGKIVFTPEANYHGEASFTYTISDGNGGVSTATVKLNVEDVNDTPTLTVESTKTVDEDGTVTINYSATDLDGTVAVEAKALHGTVSVNDDGTITYTPNPGFNGEDTITVTAMDDDNTVVIQTSAITVNDINDAPTLTVESTKMVDEDGNTTINFTATDSDGTVTVSATAEHGTVVVNDDGTITYTPDANYHGEDTITVVARDDDGAVITKTSTITVNDINDAPVIVLGDVTVTEDISQVIANVSDIDGTIDSSSLTATNGTVTIAENGEITYTPNANFNGIDSVTISITDNDGTMTTQTFDVDVAAVNDGPVAVNDVADNSAATQAIAIGALGNGVVGIDNASGNGYIMYSESNVHDRFSDNAIHGGNATNLVAVKNVDGQWFYDTNNKLVPFTPTEGDRLVAAVDFTNDTVTMLSGVTDASHKIDGIAAGFVDGDLTITANQWGGKSNTGEFGISGSTINVQSGDGTLQTNEDTAITLEPSALLSNDTDADGDTLTITKVEATDNTHGTVTINDDGKILFTPEANYNGEASFTYTISDGNGGESTTTVTLNVTSINDAPEVNVQSTASVDEDGAITINYSASDVEGDVTVTATANNGVVTINDNGTLTFTPNENYNGTDTITVTATDSNGVKTSQEVAVTVNAVNDGPKAVDDIVDGTVTMNENAADGALVFDSTGNNPELLGGAGAIDVTMTISGEPNQGQASLLSYASPSQNNEFLLFSNGSKLMVFVDGKSVETDISANDIFDGTEHKLRVDWDNTTGETKIYVDDVLADTVSIGAGKTIDTDGVIMFGQEQDSVGGGLDAGQNFKGTFHDISIATNENEVANWNMSTNNDGKVVDSVGNFDLTVTGDAVTQGSSLTTSEDTAIVLDLLVNDTDIDGDTLTITSVTPNENTHGTVAINSDGKVVFTPDANYNGEASFTYTISDGKGGTSTATVNVNVEAVEDVPVVTLESTKTVDEDGSVSLTYSATDAESAVTVEASAEHGTVVINSNGTITYTPDENYHGTDTVTVTARDENGNVTTQTSTITVDSVNDVITQVVDTDSSANEITENVADGTYTGVTVSANDVDADDNVTYSIPNDVPFKVESDGRIVTDGDIDFETAESYTFTVTATSSDGTTSTQEVTINVNDIDDTIDQVTADISDASDTGSSNSDNITKDNTPTITGTTEAGAVVVITDAAGNEVGRATANGNGEYSITTTALNDGTQDLTIKATDAAGNESTTTQSITVDTTLNLDSSVEGLNNDVTNDTTPTITGTADAGATVVITNAAGEEIGTARADADGNYSITTDALSYGAQDLTVLVTDTAGNTATNTQTFTIEKENSAPVAQNDVEITTKVYENTQDIYSISNEAGKEKSANYDLGASANSATVTVSGLGGHAWSEEIIIKALDENGNVVKTVKFDGNSNSETDFTIQSDTNFTKLEVSAGTSSLNSNVSHFAIKNVSAELTTSIKTNEDEALIIEPSSLLANDSDADADTLTITEVNTTENSHGTVTINEDGKIVFTPDANYHGEASFEYTITDGNGETSTATVSLNVSSVNDAVSEVTDSDATVNAITENVGKGTYTGVTLDATDADGEAVTYSIPLDVPFKLDADGRIVTDGIIDYEVNPSFTFDVKATSADGTVSTKSITINVNDIDDTTGITLTGDSSNETLVGTERNDTISGGLGRNTLKGGAGDDEIIITEGGKKNYEVVYGGSGEDTVVFSGNREDYVIDHEDHNGRYTVRNVNTNEINYIYDDVENFKFANTTLQPNDSGFMNDTAIGNSGNNNINAGRGDDVIDAGAGHDTVYGGVGNDTITGGLGRNTLNGGSGDDTIHITEGGSKQYERVYGGSGEDTVVFSGNRENYTIEYEEENGRYLIRNVETNEYNYVYDDVENFQFANKTVHPTDSDFTNDIVTGTNANTNIYAGDGDDVITVGTGQNNINAGSGDDTINITEGGSKKYETVRGGEGEDTVVFAGNREDYAINYEDNNGRYTVRNIETNELNYVYNDVENYQFADQTIQKGAVLANDTVTGTTGNNSINTGSGDDVIDALSGNDSINAGSGNDTITGGLGRNTITAGAGDDRVIITEGGSKNYEVVYGGSGEDTVVFAGNRADYEINYEDHNGRYSVRNTETGEMNYIYEDVENYEFADKTVHPTDSDFTNDTITTENGHDKIVSGSGDDVINSGAGNDNISAGSGNDVINAGEGTDKIYAGTGDDVITGGLGRNEINAQGGDDTIHITEGGSKNYEVVRGGSGEDTVVFSGAREDYTITHEDNNGRNVVVNNETGERNYIYDDVENIQFSDTTVTFTPAETSEGETITGTDGNESLVGTNQNDTISGGLGRNTLNGGAGDDEIIITEGGKKNYEVVYGGSGEDTVVFSGNREDYVINHEEHNGRYTVKNVSTNEVNYIYDDVENFKFADTTVQPSSSDFMNDIVTGTSGNNSISTGSGDDIIDTGAGNDSVNAGAGNDTIVGGLGRNSLKGGSGDDTITVTEGGSKNYELVYGGSGEDTVIFAGNREDYTIDYEEESGRYIVRNIETNEYNYVYDDVENFQFANKTVHPTDSNFANDVVTGTDANKNISTGDGDDVITLGTGQNSINAGAGDDTINITEGGAKKYETVRGGDGDDTVVFAGDRSDYSISYEDNNDRYIVRNIETNEINYVYSDVENYKFADQTIQKNTLMDNDTVTGTDSNNSILTGSGDDVIDGLGGNDNINAGSGNDTITGGLGRNTITAGAGDDRVVITEGGSKNYEIVYGGSGEDTVVFAGNRADYEINHEDHNGRYTVRNTSTGEINYIYEDVENYEFADTTVHPTDSNFTKDIINTEAGNDRIVSGSGDDVINSGAGNDNINAGLGNDVINSGDGHDTVNGYAGNDVINAGDGNDRVYGGDGDDIITGGLGRNDINGQGGDDTIYITEGGSKNYETVRGGDGEDTVVFSGAREDYTITHDDNNGRNIVTHNETGEKNYIYDDVEHMSFKKDLEVNSDSGVVKGDASDDTFRINDVSDLESTIDGSKGYDTLVLEEDMILDFDNIDVSKLQSIESIDMTNNDTSGKVENLDLSDVLKLTENEGIENEIMKILGDGDGTEGNSDTLELDKSKWTHKEGDTVETEDGETFDVWTNDDTTLFVDDDIYVSDI